MPPKLGCRMNLCLFRKRPCTHFSMCGGVWGGVCIVCVTKLVGKLAGEPSSVWWYNLVGGTCSIGDFSSCVDLGGWVGEVVGGWGRWELWVVSVLI